MAGVAAGQYAVEHIHPSADAFDDIGRGADAHQITGFIFREDIAAEFADAVHIFDRFADGETADGITRLVLACDELARFCPQVIEAAALHDGEERLGMSVLRLGFVHEGHAAFEPAVGQVHAVFGVLPGAGVRRAFVEGHHDVGPDAPLDAEAGFWAEEVPRAVDMAGEGGAFFGDLAPVGEAKYLVAATVGQDWTVPVHELMQSAGCLHRLHAGAEVEVVGIAKDYLGFYLFFQFGLVYAFDRPDRANGHENGRIDLAVVGGDGAGARVGFLVGVG